MPSLSHERLWNWEERLTLYLVDLRDKSAAGHLKFTWDPDEKHGMNCLQFGSGVTNAILGEDLYEALAPKADYDDAASALKVLRTLGFSDTDQLLGSIFIERRKSFVRRGDLVLVPGEDGGTEGLRQAVAVADPPFFWVVHTQGLARGHMNDALKCFEVGN